MSDLKLCRDRCRLWLQSQGLARPALLDGWLENGRLVALGRDDYLLHAGQATDLLYFLDRGLLRYFYSTADGKERNKAFYGDSQLVGAVSAAISSGPAPFSIQALETSQLLSLPFSPFLALAAEYGEVATLLIRLLSEAFIRNEQREAMLLTGNAEQRYSWLLDHEANLLERVPQHHMASYIGVDAVSLSRLKRKRRAGQNGGRGDQAP